METYQRRGQRFLRQAVREWRAFTCGQQPWTAMPCDDRTGELRPVTSELLDVAFRNRSERQSLAKLIWAAAEHGGYRRAQLCAEGLLFADYAYLREAVRMTILKSDLPARTIRIVLANAERATRVANRASIRGFHRPELEGTPEWPACLDRLDARDGE